MRTHTRLAAAVIAATALAAPTAAATPTPTPNTPTAVTAGPDDRRKTLRYWRSLNRSQRTYHCQAYDQHPARYKAGYQFGVRLDGSGAKQARQMWRSWKRILNKRCP